MKEYKYKINGNVYNVIINDIEDNIANVEVNGTPYRVEMDGNASMPSPVSPVTPVAPAAPVAPAPASRPVEAPKAEATPAAAKPAVASGSQSAIKSPLPGVIVDIKVKVGDAVKKGQTVVILEAMKMENTINADKDGVISAINVNKGDSVLEGTDLVIIG